MKCKVIYFGLIAEKLAFDSEEIDIETAIFDKSNLESSFKKRHFRLSEMTFKTAVDGVLTNEIDAENQSEIKEIAILPPFAGG